MSLDITKLLDEVEAEVKTLLKSAQEDAANLKKAEESKQEASKEASKKDEKSESSKAEAVAKNADAGLKKEDEPSAEGSGYESQAPEASEAPAAEASADPAMAAPEAGAEGDQVEDVAAIMKDLDDDMLHELYQKIKMELMARMQAQEGSADAAPAPGADAAAPAADASAAAAPEMQMAMSKSEKEFGEKLSKAETELKNKDSEIEKLKKSLSEYEQGASEMADMLKMVLEKPVVRAVTDVSFVSKDGEPNLKKSETEISDADLKKKVDEISADRRKLATLTKGEVDTISDFYAGKNVKEKIAKIVINK